MTPQTLLAQGAEAKIFRIGNKIVKDRIKKSYRLPILDDKIRKSRTKKEKRLLEKAGKIIHTPKIEDDDDKTKIKMQYLAGKKLSEHLDRLTKKQQTEVCKKIGKNIANLHSQNIIHGDLTTSNMILTSDKILYFIDFGLGYGNGKYEDKAVDLHLLKQALEAKHYKNWETLWKQIEKEYKSQNKNEAEKVLNQLNKVEKRGRYKH